MLVTNYLWQRFAKCSPNRWSNKEGNGEGLKVCVERRRMATLLLERGQQTLGVRRPIEGTSTYPLFMVVVAPLHGNVSSSLP
jgi:hypothetical protein